MELLDVPFLAVELLLLVVDEFVVVIVSPLGFEQETKNETVTRRAIEEMIDLFISRSG